MTLYQLYLRLLLVLFLTIIITNISRKIEKTGELSISCKFVYTKGEYHHPLEYDLFPNDDGEQILYMPIWVDIVNNSDVSKVCKNLSVFSYKNGKEVDELTQVQYETNRSMLFQYADEGTYSFVIQPNSVKRYELLYTMKDFEMDIDGFIMQYTTENNKLKKYKLLELDNEWKEKMFINYNKKWFTLEHYE